jgi:hypothetical protein
VKRRALCVTFRPSQPLTFSPSRSLGGFCGSG